MNTSHYLTLTVGIACLAAGAYVLLCAPGWRNPMRWISAFFGVLDTETHNYVIDNWGESSLLIFRILILGIFIAMLRAVIRQRRSTR